MPEFDPNKLAKLKASFDPAKLAKATATGSAQVSPGDVPPDLSTMGAAKMAVGEALEAPIPGVGGAMQAAQTGLESASVDAAKWYSDMGVPRIGKAVETGGKFLAGAIPVKMKDALFIATAGPALEAAAAVGAPIAKLGGNIMADVAARLVGKSPEALKVIFNKPGAIWKKATELFGLKNQELLVNEIEAGLASKGKQFGELAEVFSGFTQKSGVAGLTPPPVEMRTVLKEVLGTMMERGHKLPKTLSGKSQIRVGKLAEDSADYIKINEKLEFLKKHPKMTFGEALNFRQQVDDMIDYGVEGSAGLQKLTGEGNRVLKLVRRRVNTNLRESLPSDVRALWDKANFDYSRARGAYAELKKSVIGQTDKQTETKMLQMIREGRYDDSVAKRAQRIGEQAAKALDDVRDHLAAKEFSRWAGPGLSMGGASGAGFYFGGIPGAVAGAVATSPRAVGTATSIAGGLSQIAGSALEHPQTMRGVVSGLENLNK